MDHHVLDDALARADITRRLPRPARRRRLRERAGLLQLDIARALGVTRVAVSYYETGQRVPRPATAAAYLAILERLA